MNNNCEWPAESGIRPLVQDVRTIEELALRYADTRFDSESAHGRLRAECEAKLFGMLPAKHGVSVEGIATARAQLAQNSFDPPVHLPLVLFYLAVVAVAVRRIRRRFSADEVMPVVIATVFVSVGIAVGFIVLGHLWDGVVEMLRVGNTHMSYRAERLGFREHTGKVVALAMGLFWCVVLGSYWVPRGSSRTRQMRATRH